MSLLRWRHAVVVCRRAVLRGCRGLAAPVGVAGPVGAVRCRRVLGQTVVAGLRGSGRALRLLLRSVRCGRLPVRRYAVTTWTERARPALRRGRTYRCLLWLLRPERVLLLELTERRLIPTSLPRLTPTRLAPRRLTPTEVTSTEVTATEVTATRFTARLLAATEFTSTRLTTRGLAADGFGACRVAVVLRPLLVAVRAALWLVAVRTGLRLVAVPLLLGLLRGRWWR